MPRIRTRVRPGAKSPSAIDSDPGRYENRLLLILFLAFGFVFFDRQASPFLAPFISREIHLSDTELGTLSGVLALTWALSGLVAGRLPDTLGRRKPIPGALMGVAEGAVLPLAQSLMVVASRENRRGLTMGLLQGSWAGQAVEGERSPVRGTV